MSDEEKLRKLREQFGGDQYKECSQCGKKYKKEMRQCPDCNCDKHEVKQIYPGMSL